MVGGRWMRLACAASLLFGGACASAGKVGDRDSVDALLRDRAGAGLRSEANSATPPGITSSDGLTPDDAVAIALWNNPAFQVTLSDLGLARADLIDARQIRNPVFSLLFPWGPKQLEWTLQFPIDAIWQRPKRIKVASANAEATAARLMSDGLGVVALARSAYVDASAGNARLRLALEGAEVWGRLRSITEARLREGDISEFEARSVRSEAAMAVAAARGAEGDRDAARIRLDAVLGTRTGDAALRSMDDLAIGSCEVAGQQISDAMAARPDVRAAELAIEAAGAQAGLERSRILTLTATLDANGAGRAGFEMGPGLAGDIPINGNRGARARAAALLEQATLRYAALRFTIEAELRTATVRLVRARQVLRVWDEEVIQSLEIERQQSSKAYEAGEVPLLNVLDTARRLVTAQRARLEARVEMLQAAIALDRSLGRSCAFP